VFLEYSRGFAWLTWFAIITVSAFLYGPSVTSQVPNTDNTSIQTTQTLRKHILTHVHTNQESYIFTKYTGFVIHSLILLLFIELIGVTFAQLYLYFWKVT